MQGSERYNATPWILHPPIAGDWVDLPQDKATILQRRLLEVAPIAPEYAVELVRLAPLDFYPGWLLCDIQVRSASDAADARNSAPFRRAIFSYLYGPDGFTGLSGHARLFRDHNLRHGIDLRSARKRQNYLRFYCFFVRGDEGPFEIIEFDTALEFGDKRDPTELEAIRATVRPLRKSRPPKNQAIRHGAHFYEACMYYDRSLFSAKFSLHQSGAVEMVDDDPLGSDVRRVPLLGFSGCARFPSWRHQAHERSEA